MMSPEQIVTALVADLRDLKHWCSTPVRDPCREGIDYIADNRVLLGGLLDQLAAVSASTRRDWFINNRELDEAIIADDLSVARNSIAVASAVRDGNRLLVLTDDDVNMILRPIEYAKFLSPLHCVHPPVGTPLELPS